jgi:hypothetical protein
MVSAEMSAAQVTIAAKMLRMNADAAASLPPPSGEISTLQCSGSLTGRRAFMSRLSP